MDISISVVSHSQIALVANLLQDLRQHCGNLDVELILTLNMKEPLPPVLDCFAHPIRIIRNAIPAGFGANHNQAFAQAGGKYFCVLNPDIRLAGDPFTALLACMDHASVGVVAPLVLSENGAVQDSARCFPSPLNILCKVFGRPLKPDYVIDHLPIHVDWVAGMFMLFPRSVFEQLSGFDERYFLYYEDVDICARLKLLGYAALLCPQARVTHIAHRSSHRSLKYMRWHLSSMVRFFLSPAYRRIK